MLEIAPMSKDEAMCVVAGIQALVAIVCGAVFILTRNKQEGGE